MCAECKCEIRDLAFAFVRMPVISPNILFLPNDITNEHIIMYLLRDHIHNAYNSSFLCRTRYKLGLEVRTQQIKDIEIVFATVITKSAKLKPLLKQDLS